MRTRRLQQRVPDIEPDGGHRGGEGAEEMNHAWVLLLQALYAAAGMLWDIFWGLVLGFTLSAGVTVFAPHRRLTRLLGDSSPRTWGIAALLGAVSSSCSYAAASMMRSLFQKGAHIVPALAFMMASTNLVIEMSAVLWSLMGWPFVAAELLGGVFLIVVMGNLLHLWQVASRVLSKFLGRSIIGPIQAFDVKREELDESHAEPASKPVLRPDSLASWQAVATTFAAETRMIWKDVAFGVTASGLLMVFVPDQFWQSLFFKNSGQGYFVTLVENALVGPLVSFLSFACSVGNIPLARVLYHGGISFGGAISFIYADLITLPMILVYRRYYGWKLAFSMSAVFYVSMAITGIGVDLLFDALGWIPAQPSAAHAHGASALHTMVANSQAMPFFSLNYTFVLNVIALAVASALIWIAKSSAPTCCHTD